MFYRSANILSRVSRFLPLHRRPAQRRTAPDGTRLAVETLEDRCLPSSYSITEISQIAPTFTSPSPIQYPVSAINNAALTQVAGTAFAAPGAYFWDSIHGVRQLGTVKNEADSAASSINNAGQVVGISSTTTEKFDKKGGGYYFTYTENGFLWSSSAGMKDLGSNVAPAAINNSGQIAADITSTSGTQGPFLSNGKTWVPLGNLPGGANSDALGINDYGQVVGYSQTNTNRAFLWTPSRPNSTSGSMIDLGSFLSGGDSTAVAINRQGWVTGNAAVPLSPPAGGYIGVDHAFLWKPMSSNGTTGTLIDLGTLDPKANGGLGQSWGLAINSGGVVVGESNPTGATSTYQTDAVIWQPGTTGSYTLSDLNNLIPSGTGWTLGRADSINDNGQIVVEATNPSLGTGWYALLLTPTPTAPPLSATNVQPAASGNTTPPRTAPMANTLPSGLALSPPPTGATGAANLPAGSITGGNAGTPSASSQQSSAAAAMPAPTPARPVDVFDQLLAQLDAAWLAHQRKTENDGW
jgi:probable HAF family extracellular repeat protein